MDVISNQDVFYSLYPVKHNITWLAVPLPTPSRSRSLLSTIGVDDFEFGPGFQVFSTDSMLLVKHETGFITIGNFMANGIGFKITNNSGAPLSRVQIKTTTIEDKDNNDQDQSVATKTSSGITILPNKSFVGLQTSGRFRSISILVFEPAKISNIVACSFGF